MVSLADETGATHNRTTPSEGIVAVPWNFVPGPLTRKSMRKPPETGAAVHRQDIPKD